MTGSTSRVSRHAQLVQSAARKLEQHRTIFAITGGEYCAVRDLMKAAAVYVDTYRALHPRTRNMSRVFLFEGAKYRINYTAQEGALVCMAGSPVKFSSKGFAI